MDARGNDTNEMGDNLPAVDLGTGRTATAIQSGLYHTCAILDDGSVKCWGDNYYGQLGQGDTDNRGDGANEMGDKLLKVDLGTNGQSIARTAKKISVGVGRSCAILDDNTTKCWGGNRYGGLGLGDDDNRGDATGEMGNNLPAVDLGTSPSRYAVTISAGSQHTCALLDDATVKCWGANNYGQLGYGNNTYLGGSPNQMGNNLLAVNVGDKRTVTGLFAGPWHTCVTLANATSKCWGNSNSGQLGYGNTTQLGHNTNDMANLVALNLGGNTASAFITSRKGNTNYDFVCVLLTTGKIRCWDHNGQGQLGYGDVTDRVSVPSSLSDIDLGTDRTVHQMAMGDGHACAILDNYDLKCWGYNNAGQLGYGDDRNLGDEPNEMGGKLGSIDTGSTSTPSITLTKSNTVTPSKTPTASKTRTATPIGGIKEVVSIATGDNHACAILANDTVKCWGNNSAGQLGYGDKANRGDGADEMGSSLTAVDLGSGHTAKAISAGVAHTCAILENGSVKCWGYNGDGQLAIPTPIESGSLVVGRCIDTPKC